MPELRALITGAGAPGIRGTLYALRSNPDGCKVATIGVDMKEDVVGRYFVDRFYRVPAPNHQTYVQTLVDICKKEDIQIIVPQTTNELFTLAENKVIFTEMGVQVLVSDSTAISVANDKFRTLQIFQQLQLPHPAYYLVKTKEELVEAAYTLGYPTSPVIVKPPISNGMRGLRILKEEAWDVSRFLSEKPSGIEISLSVLLDILERGENWPELLLCEYLSGPEYSVDAFIGQHVQVAIPRHRQVIRSGISFQNSLENNKYMQDYTLLGGLAMGVKYAFGFQFKLDAKGTPKVLECNPRIQGTMAASIFSNINVIWLGIQEALGNAPLQLPQIDYASDFYRYWGGIFVVGGSQIYDI
jgi:carbamoyl-phosphate synthase large subunit